MSRIRTLKLPNGRHIETWNPVKEFEKNIKIRRGALFYSDRPDRLTARDLTDLWERDAINRRRGILKPADRAVALGIAITELTAFDEKVRELERGIWKKAAECW